MTILRATHIVREICHILTLAGASVSVPGDDDFKRMPRTKRRAQARRPEQARAFAIVQIASGEVDEHNGASWRPTCYFTSARKLGIRSEPISACLDTEA